MLKNDESYMKLAIKEALKSLETDDVPIGCVIVCDDKVIARAHNEKEKHKNALNHAEMVAINKASKKLGHWRMHNCTIYVTLEPCSMCAGGIINARFKRVVFGSKDPRCGAFGSKLNLNDYNLECKPETISCVLEDECSHLLSDFFKKMRNNKK